MGIKLVDDCVGCPEWMGCLGSACPYRDVPVVTCDECEMELFDGEIFKVDNDILCIDCLKERFEISLDSLLDDMRDQDECNREKWYERDDG